MRGQNDISNYMRLRIIALGCLLALQSFAAFSAAPAKLNRENNFDLNWRFLKADAPGAENCRLQ